MLPEEAQQIRKGLVLHDVALDDALDQQEHEAHLFPGWDDPHTGLPMGAANLHHAGDHLLIRSCKPIGNPGVTAVAVGENALRLYLLTMDLGQQPHPGKNLRHAGRQGEAVGDIMIATRTML